jgi:hypothetical protein
VKYTSYETFHYTVSSSLLFLNSSWGQTFSSALCSQPSSVYIHPLKYHEAVSPETFLSISPYLSIPDGNWKQFSENDYTIFCILEFLPPTDGVSTLSWWWGLSAPETLKAMPAVA